MAMHKAIKIILFCICLFSNGYTYALKPLNIHEMYAEQVEDIKDCPHDGKSITKERLKELIASQEIWSNEYTLAANNDIKNELLKDSRRIKLCGAILKGVDLSGYDLAFVNFTNANLEGADLSFAYLKNANFAGAKLAKSNFEDADLTRASFANTDLTKADLSRATLHNSRIYHTDFKQARIFAADFSKSLLYKANFTNAIVGGSSFKDSVIRNSEFRDAELSGASFSGAGFQLGTSLSGAHVVDVDFSNVVYEIKINSHPELSDLLLSSNLHKLRFIDDPAPLYDLRNVLYKSGLHNTERKITYALESTKRENLWDEGFFARIESAFKLIFFEIPTLWGMEPGRAIKILLLLIILFWPAYIVALYSPKKDGIWRRWNKDRSRQDLGSDTPQLVKMTLPNSVGTGLYFSLLSAFHFGWRDLNVGNWIMRIQSKEYTLSATGWVRSFSGIQSLISMYLLVIWVLTYFGRPFG